MKSKCIGIKCKKYDVCVSGYSPCLLNRIDNIVPPKGGSGEIKLRGKK